jgi:glyceraldehyde 3-phosphate dehydrogenase
MSTIHAVTNTQSVLDTASKANVLTDHIGIDAAVIIEGQFNHTRTAFINLDLSNIPNCPADIIKAFPEKLLKVPVVHSKIFGWYDNEYGSYTNRMGDLTVYIHKNLL